MSFFEKEDDGFERLLLRARHGDGQAWVILVERLQSIVYSCARRCGLNADDAADVFQATFIALHENLDRIDQPRALRGWMAVTSTREALRIKRISSKYAVSVDDERGLVDVLASEEATADALADEAVQSDELRKALTRLGGKCQKLLEALFFEDKTYQDITHGLGIPPGAIGPTRSRCLEKLKKLYFGTSEEPHE